MELLLAVAGAGDRGIPGGAWLLDVRRPAFLHLHGDAVQHASCWTTVRLRQAAHRLHLLRWIHRHPQLPRMLRRMLRKRLLPQPSN